MKKSLLSLAMALGIGLFASCSQEEIISGNENSVETVSVSAQLPGDAVQTRAILGAADANHQLRCILEVWNTADNTVIQRIEKLGSEAANGKLQFTFNVPSATDYECLLWADFIASDATATDGKYADKYYTTTSLKAIDFKVTDAGLFNNESADAFCGAVAKNGTVNNLSVTLKRPFTRVTLKDNSDYLASVASLAPSFEAPSMFDVSTGKTAGYTQVSATGIAPDSDAKTLFYAFFFASTAQSKLDKDITIEFTKTAGGTETKTIKAGQITLDYNVKNDVTADYAVEGTDVTVDVDIDDQYPDPNVLKIGQFVNKDGSVSDTYNAETTCGIIFAVGAQGDDAAANYASFESKTIAGYVMALSNVEGKPFAAEPDMPADSQEAALASFSGMKLTNGILSYIETNSVDAPLFTNFNNWKMDNATTGANLSAWYVPSYQQLVTFVGYIYGTPTGSADTDPAFPASIAKNETFSAAVASANAGDFLGTASTRNILSSSFTTAKKAACVQFTSATGFKTVVPGKLINALSMRPVLTVFKSAE